MNCLRFGTKRIYPKFPLRAIQAQLLSQPFEVEKQILDSYTPCLPCRRNQFQSLHTSEMVAAAKFKNMKKKSVAKPINVRLKKKQQAEVVTIWKNMTVQELANTMKRDKDDVYEAMMYVENSMKYDNDAAAIDSLQVVQDICKKCGFRFVVGKNQENIVKKENKDIFKSPAADPKHLVRKPPVVTIMGHVDHGKTTLLDNLRKSNIVQQEFGGITQHIGAFSVTLPSGESITFLDTPGHAAFSAMRARGAQATDIVVLVVAAEDGVMNQTIESIQHAKEAEVPIIVAINKIDKPEANIEAVKTGLQTQGLLLEEYGGDIQVVPISALKSTNLIQLQEAIVTQAELMELQADPAGLMEGVVIESRTDPGRGKLATILVQRGTVRKGINIIAGLAWAKVRAMFDDQGRPVQSAGPGVAVEVIGWKELPSAGDEILQVEKESRLKEALAWRQEQEKLKKMEKDAIVIEQKVAEHQIEYQQRLREKLESGRRSYRRQQKQKETIETHTGPQLAVVLKGDVDGSVEAILDTLDTYKSDQCRLDLIHYGVGTVTENDIELASTFNGVIMGFNIKVADNIKKLASTKTVPLKLHNVIYRLFEDLTDLLNSRLPSVQIEEVVGEANVLEVFQITDEKKKKIQVAGCRCVKGNLNKRMLCKLVRRGEVVHEGALSSLKHFKNEVDTIKTDMECGLSFDDKRIEFQRGDQLVCYKLVETQQTIDWEPGF